MGINWTEFRGNDIRLDWVMPRKVESERLTIRKSWMPSAESACFRFRQTSLVTDAALSGERSRICQHKENRRRSANPSRKVSTSQRQEQAAVNRLRTSGVIIEDNNFWFSCHFKSPLTKQNRMTTCDFKSISLLLTTSTRQGSITVQDCSDRPKVLYRLPNFQQYRVLTHLSGRLSRSVRLLSLSQDVQAILSLAIRCFR